MRVKKSIKLEDGTYNVDADFSAEEMDSIIEIGLNVLLAHGALPFQATEDQNDTYTVIPPSNLEH